MYQKPLVHGETIKAFFCIEGILYFNSKLEIQDSTFSVLEIPTPNLRNCATTLLYSGIKHTVHIISKTIFAIILQIGCEIQFKFFLRERQINIE